MKTFKIILSILLASSLFACSSSGEKGNSIASFVQFGSHQWEKGNFDCNATKEKCAVVKLNYPEAIFGNEKVRASINAEIKDYVVSELAKAARVSVTSGKSIEELADVALENYSSSEKDALSEVAVFGQVMFRNNNLIKLELSSFQKNNDGKINSNRSLYTFDTHEGKILSQTNLNNGAPKLAEISMN
ncbi:MAG: hypothetical protein MRZ79_08605 [Bacteroidia bacterium]|nr:hypothetical protein [Bacteroidia bacterium]